MRMSTQLPLVQGVNVLCMLEGVLEGQLKNPNLTPPHNLCDVNESRVPAEREVKASGLTRGIQQITLLGRGQVALHVIFSQQLCGIHNNRQRYELA